MDTITKTQIGWFCDRAVNEGLLTSQQCKTIAWAFVEQKVPPDLETFVYTAIENEMSTDPERLEQLMEVATQETRRGRAWGKFT